MKTVTFATDYNHLTRTGHIAYKAGESFSVADDVADAAEKAGALADEPAPAKKP